MAFLGLQFRSGREASRPNTSKIYCDLAVKALNQGRAIELEKLMVDGRNLARVKNAKLLEEYKIADIHRGPLAARAVYLVPMPDGSQHLVLNDISLLPPPATGKYPFEQKFYDCGAAPVYM